MMDISQIKYTAAIIRPIFPKVNDDDLPILADLLNKKCKHLAQKQYRIDFDSRQYDDDEFIKDMGEYMKELSVEYDKTGLKENWDKINKIHKLLETNLNYPEDFRIVEEIRKEYLENKKMQKWTMLYLNKIYKELTKEK